MDHSGAPLDGQEQAPQPASTQPLESTHVLPSQNQALPSMHPALAAINPAAMASLAPSGAGAYQMQHPAGPAAGMAQMQQPFFFPNMVQFAASAPPPRRQNRLDTAVGKRTSAGDRKRCNCKNSRCLKLYCECFSSGLYCDGCNCNNCFNNASHEEVRQAAIESILERNPNAFRPKIAGPAEEVAGAPPARHNKGCNCKKSGCLKKYCECFQAGITCSENCRCVDCKNFEGSAARASIIAAKAARGGATLGPSQLIARPGGVRLSSAGGLGKSDGPGLISPLSQANMQLLTKAAMGELITPEVIEKLGVLLMMVTKEEAERRRVYPTATREYQGVGPADALNGSENRREDLYAEQERLVLREFRDAIRMITKVIGSKLDVKVKAAVEKQAAAASKQAQQQQAAAAAIAQMQQQVQQQVHQAQLKLAQQQISGSQQFQIYKGGPIPQGMQPVYSVHGGQSQILLVPQALMVQQVVDQQQQTQALSQQMAATTVQQQSQGGTQPSGNEAEPLSQPPKAE